MSEIRVERDDVALAERELERAQQLALQAADEIVGAEVHRVRGLAALLDSLARPARAGAGR